MAMTNYTIYTNLYRVFLFLLVIAAAACKKSYTGMIEDETKNRAFTPSNLRVSTVRDSAKFYWNQPLYLIRSDKYELEISTDSLFSKVDYKTVADTAFSFVLDTAIRLNTLYFARVRVKENTAQQKMPSDYFYNTRSFRLVGQQYFKVLRDFEITSTSALLHWYTGPQTAGLTQMAIIREGADTVTINLAATDVNAGQTLLANLLPKTRYTLQLLAGKKSKGILTFTTLEEVNYTKVLSPADNLATAIANAQHGDVIGLNPGTYNLTSITYITQKRIAIRGVSNNPADTKINSRELNLVGDSAGITLTGVEVNGNYSGTSYGATFIQLLGTQATTNAAAAFTLVKIDNCIIHDYTRAIIRANYGAAANTQSVESISINNTRIYNIDQANTQGYYTFSLEKLQIRSFLLQKSTLYNVGDGLINMSTNLLTTTNIVPDIKVDYCTINGFGGGASKYLFIDANGNKIVYNFSNSIVANSPISGSLQAAAFRASNTANVLTYANNNTFNLLSTPGGGAVNLTGLQIANPNDWNLGWTAATTNFSLNALPADHAIFFASTNGNTLGDPRWAY
jgi:hypothetical protein